MSLLWRAESMSVAQHICNVEFHTFSHTHTRTHTQQHTHKHTLPFLSVFSWYATPNRAGKCTDKSHAFPETHLQDCMHVACFLQSTRILHKWTKQNTYSLIPYKQKHTSSTHSSQCRICGTTCFLPHSSSFTHSFLPCIPPGAPPAPRTTDPPYFIHNNPCLFLLYDHTLP